MKWALIGVGNIAHKFMQASRVLPDVDVAAVYGRNADKAEAFCHTWEIGRWYTDYEKMCRETDADIIYIATPHIVHCEHTLTALRCKKHVLCEKPMAMSEQEAVLLAKEAAVNGVFLMEAMWTRFFPLTKWLTDFIQTGEFGEPVNVNADFSFEYPYDPNYRFFRSDLGGGSMRSAGIYPLAFASMVFRSVPEHVMAMADMKNGVDLRCAALLRFPERKTAQLHTGFQGQSKCMANIAFQKGSVVVPDFYHPSKAVVTPLNAPEKTIRFPYEDPGLQFEIQHVESCVQAELRESLVMPLAETIALARITDLIYTQIRKEKTDK